MKVLVVAEGYLPGFRFGGPVRTLAAMVEHLGDEIDFRIVASAFDLGESSPYPGITLDTWTRVGKAEVWYTKSRRLSPMFWKKVIAEANPDVVYLNSFMCPVTSAFLLWRKMRLIPEFPVILVPRGEFAPSALAIKRLKKQSFLTWSNWIDLHRGIVWQASTEAEANDIAKAIRVASQVVVAPNLVVSSGASPDPLPKDPGEVRFIWLGRIAPVKNLIGALKYLAGAVDGNITFDVFGPVEDEKYWSRCRQVATHLPTHARFEYRGELEHSEVAGRLNQYHFLLFPTFGENFGHSIAEALGQGLPVLVSDQTPWRNLEEFGVGWDIGLDRLEEWFGVINRCVSMGDTEYRMMSERCGCHLDHWMEKRGGREANRKMFHLAAASPSQV